jgi:RNA-binding protein YhbY
MRVLQVQLGKNGVTSNFIQTLKGHFENHDIVKVSILKNCSRDKEEIKEMMNNILEGLGRKYTAKLMGFTIILKRWRREMW